MMAGSATLQTKAGYIYARPPPPDCRNLLATHGRTIHLGQTRSSNEISARSGLPPRSDLTADILDRRLGANNRHMQRSKSRRRQIGSGRAEKNPVAETPG